MRARAVGLAVLRKEQHEIDVGGEIQLAAAELAHRQARRAAGHAAAAERGSPYRATSSPPRVAAWRRRWRHPRMPTARSASRRDRPIRPDRARRSARSRDGASGAAPTTLRRLEHGVGRSGAEPRARKSPAASVRCRSCCASKSAQQRRIASAEPARRSRCRRRPTGQRVAHRGRCARQRRRGRRHSPAAPRSHAAHAAGQRRSSERCAVSSRHCRRDRGTTRCRAGGAGP